MVTLLLILMVACNLWVLLYLTWERKESRKADGKDGIEPAREPLPDVIGKSKFRMPETKPQATTSTTRTGSLTGSSHRQAEIPLTKSTVRQGR